MASDAEKVDRLVEIVHDLKAEIGTICAETGQVMSPENAARLEEYVRGVMVRTNARLTELGIAGYV